MIRYLLRLCFRPTPEDRFWRAMINVAATLIAAVGVCMSFYKGQPWGALSSVFMVFWNGVNIWANLLIYRSWRYDKPMPWFLQS